MKISTILFTLLFGGSFILFSCNQSKNIDNKETNSEEKGNMGCDKTATVMNYKGLDGCSYLLKLEDGSFLSPTIKDPKVFDFRDFAKAKRVSISYVNTSGMMSTCMKGKIVEIKCCSIIEEGEPMKPATDEF